MCTELSEIKSNCIMTVDGEINILFVMAVLWLCFLNCGTLLSQCESLHIHSKRLRCSLDAVM